MSATSEPRGVLVVDLGAQYSQLIARRVREACVWSEIAPPAEALAAARRMNLAGIVLSGGPASVYAEDAPAVPAELLQLGVPVLGICYGMQWMCQRLGGGVRAADRREFGRTAIVVERPEDIFHGIDGHTAVWMSHGDQVVALPEGFRSYARSENCEYAAVGDPERGFFGLQFHPEVTHTARGREVIENFLTLACRLEGDWRPASIVEREVERVRAQVGEDGEVVLGLSGGVDSSVTAVILHRAIGERLHCIFVDNGLLRKGERETVERVFARHFHVDLTVVDASERFLSELDGVTDPEQKRMVIGREFVEVFRREAKRIRSARFLGQGTLYPDVIESVNVHGGNTAVIKSHHNVGGLPDDMEMELHEPLYDLYKDEVRAVARHQGIEVAERQPFPGPGLAVRVIGELTPERVMIAREACHIMETEVHKAVEAGQMEAPWQYFAVLTNTPTVGVQGDLRAYGETVAVRAVQSFDAMTAQASEIPWPVLQKVSRGITNHPDLKDKVNRVVYDITDKPPATVEWE